MRTRKSGTGTWRWATAGLLACMAAAAPLGAQQGRGDRGGPGQGSAQSPAQTAEMERRVHQRVAEIVQRELRLSPEQSQRLQAVSRQFEAQRRPLFQREVQIRRALRQQLSAGDGADQARVEEYMGEMLQLQRRRLDVVEAEQRALSEFLTPVQRARYLALQENLRSRVEQQRGRDGRRAGGPPPPANRPR